jgi:hypothetical protein
MTIKTIERDDNGHPLYHAGTEIFTDTVGLTTARYPLQFPADPSPSLQAVGDRLERLAWGPKRLVEEEEENMTFERIAKLETKVDSLIDGLKIMSDKLDTSMGKIEQTHAGCRERCDVSRGAMYDRIRDIESEQMVNKGAHEVIDKEKARHPHVQVADRTGLLVIATLVLVIADVVLKIWKG